MCGRTVLATPPDDLREIFGLEEIPDLTPRYNVAPSQPIAVVREPRRLELLRWGLATKPGTHHAGINVRIETVARAPAYRTSFQTRRCLIVVDGFFEWRRQGKTSLPFLLRRPDGKPFALAGIWDRSITADGEVVDSCAVITKPAEGPVAEIHDRMPLILVPEQYEAWLDRQQHDAARLLAPRSMELAAARVGLVVNNPANDDPRCIAPPDEDEAKPESAPQQTRWSF